MERTSLWDGLRTGLKVLTDGQRKSGSNAALFLLTDGVQLINHLEDIYQHYKTIKQKLILHVQSIHLVLDMIWIVSY